MANTDEVSQGAARKSLQPSSPRGRDSRVLLLTWAAGSVDAISYLGLGRVFTANMTGNAVLLGLALGQGQGLASLRSIIALGGFGLGVALGALIVERHGKRGEWSPAVTRAVLLEGIVLGIFTLTWHLPGAARTGDLVYALIALSAVAMGIQSAAIRHLNVPGIATTYITGTLTSFMVGIVNWLRPAGRSKPAGQLVVQASPAARWERGTGLQAAVFVLYGLAAIVSGIFQAHWSALVAVSPLLAVGLVVVAASLRPEHRTGVEV